MRLNALVIVAGLAIVAAPGLAAQSPPGWKWHTDAPANWVATTDQPADSTFAFVRMPPGWHMTMGPGGVLYEPRYFAEGSFTLETNIFHFPNNSAAEYGLMLGGALLVEFMMWSGRADVLFTSYVPLRAHPLFYLGVIVGFDGAATPCPRSSIAPITPRFRAASSPCCEFMRRPIGVAHVWTRRLIGT